MFGSHLSIAGGLVNALSKAIELKLDCVQVFTKNQRQWRVPMLKDDARDAWLSKLEEMAWRTVDGPARTVSHNSYLINLASPDRAMRARSIALQREEMERCEALDIPLLVAHPGAHLGIARPTGEPHEMGNPPTRDELAGLKRIARATDKLHGDLPGYNVTTCFETTVGSGTNLGYDFGHLAMLRDLITEPQRIGFCVDTCHITAAGYDMTTAARAKRVIAIWRETCGLDSIRVVHMNDSVGKVGSRRDRHAHIGFGECSMACFRVLVNLPELADVPKVLETPKEEDDSGVSWDVRNTRRLKRLVRPAESRR